MAPIMVYLPQTSNLSWRFPQPTAHFTDAMFARPVYCIGPFLLFLQTDKLSSVVSSLFGGLYLITMDVEISVPLPKQERLSRVFSEIRKSGISNITSG